MAENKDGITIHDEKIGDIKLSAAELKQLEGNVTKEAEQDSNPPPPEDKNIVFEGEKLTQAEFEKRSADAIKKGFFGIDMDGNPTNDMLKVDTIGPAMRHFMDAE